MKKIIKWFKENKIWYFTVFGLIFYCNGFLFEIMSFDFAMADKERALFRIQYVKNNFFVIHLFFIEFSLWEQYKIK